MTLLQLKATVRARDGHTCTECGMTNDQHLELHGRSLDVHRVIPGSRYSVEGCVTLCRTCHGPKPRRERGQMDLALIAQRVVCHCNQDFLAFIDEQADLNDRTRTAEILRALKAHYQRVGLWPPKNEGWPPPAAPPEGEDTP